MDTIKFDGWVSRYGFSDSEIFYNVILAGGHVLRNMTAEGVRRLLVGGEKLEMVIARRWDDPANQQPVATFEG